MSKDETNAYSDIIGDVNTIWRDFSEQMEKYLNEISDEKAYKQLYEQWKEYQEKTVKQISEVMEAESPADISEMFKRWMDFSCEFESVLDSFKGKEFPDEINELFKNYIENIREPLFNTLSMSIKEHYKRQEDLYDQWIDSWAKLSDEDEGEFGQFMKMYRDTCSESFGNISDQFMSAFRQGDAGGLTRRMEKEWLKMTSEMVQQILRSKPYAAVQGTYLDNLLDSRITQKELMDTYLKSLGMPTRDDMLKLYESVHELTSRIRAIERKLDSLPMEP